MGKFLDTLTNGLNKLGFGLRKNAPEIMVGAGVVGVLAAGVLACRATIKAMPVIDEHKKKVQAVREYEDLDEKARDRSIAKVYFQTGTELAKLYAPPILIGTAAIASFLGSHKIMKDRNIATAAYAAALGKTLTGYRKKMAEKLGEDKEKEIWMEQKKDEAISVKEEEKKLSSEGEKKRNHKLNGYSYYARIFDCGNPGWEDNPEFTSYYLRAAQKSLNDQLESRGYLFLNEAYKQLGYQPTQEGQRVGWLYDPLNHPKIDFGLFNLNVSKEEIRAKSDFLDGVEQNIVLDFNVDGVIVNKLPKV